MSPPHGEAAARDCRSTLSLQLVFVGICCHDCRDSFPGPDKYLNSFWLILLQLEHKCFGPFRGSVKAALSYCFEKASNCWLPSLIQLTLAFLLVRSAICSSARKRWVGCSAAQVKGLHYFDRLLVLFTSDLLPADTQRHPIDKLHQNTSWKVDISASILRVSKAFPRFVEIVNNILEKIGWWASLSYC